MQTSPRRLVSKRAHHAAHAAAKHAARAAAKHSLACEAQRSSSAPARAMQTARFPTVTGASVRALNEGILGDGNVLLLTFPCAFCQSIDSVSAPPLRILEGRVELT